MPLPIPVSITNDLAMPLIPIVMTFHDVVPPPPAPPIPFAPCIEPPVMMMWPPGFALFQNKFTTTVLHKAMPIALDGHNCGYMLVHVSIPAANLLTPMQIMFSSRKMVFSAAKVKANGTPIATTAPILFPMMCCAQPVTMPTGAAPTNCLNTVSVGVTLIDAIIGWISIIATVVIDYCFYRKPKALEGADNIEKIVNLVVRQLGDLKWKLLLGDKPAKAAWKAAVGALAGLAKIAYTGEGNVSISLGSGYLGGSISYTRGTDGGGSNAVGVAGNEVTSDRLLGPAKGTQGSAQYTWRADGTSTTTTGSKSATADSGIVSTDGSQRTSSTSTNYDEDGNLQGTSTKKTATHTDDSPWSGETELQQQKVTTQPGQPQKTSSSNFSGASSWGKPL
jgi:hypothetical protein